jgi:predicted Zn finger-like uncharacterized protein
MYTQCPECQIAFRVTARVLQQAGGKVRCGGCDSAFNALDYLSEDMPVSASNEDSGPAALAVGKDLDETSRRLLETLNELAGPDEVRIEDTGIEWRVLGETDEAIEGQGLNYPSDTGSMYGDEAGIPESAVAADDAVADQESLDLGSQPFEERRYDDNTPLPDDFDSQENQEFRPPPEPRRRDSDQRAEGADLDELQADLALSDPSEWTELLDEVADADAIPMEVEEELAAIHSQLTMRERPEPVAAPSAAIEDDEPEAAPVDLDTQFELQAEALGITGTRQIIADIQLPAAEDDLTDEVPLLDESFTEDDERDAAPATREIELSADDEIEGEERGDIDVIDFAGGGADYDSGATGEFVLDEADFARRDDAADGEQDLSGEYGDETEAEVGEEFAAVDDDEEQWRETGEFAAMGPVEDEDVSEDIPLELHDDDAEELLDDVEQIGAGDPDDPVIELDLPSSRPHYRRDAATESREDAAAGKVLSDDQLAASVFGADHASRFFDENSGEVETIIMEGESVRAGIEQHRRAAEREAQAHVSEARKLADTYALNREKLRGGRRSYDPPGYVMIIGVIVLGILLLAQIVHASRDSFATSELFGRTVAPIYRLLGRPITPQWDIKGWQFEATSGSTDDSEEVLTVVTRIANVSAQPLPYPLVHVSLTDRWEEIIGSRVLEPNEYLAGDLDPSRPVTAGENFTAVITIENPSREATGFKLNVCYRVVPGRVRCAIEDFKN